MITFVTFHVSIPAEIRPYASPISTDPPECSDPNRLISAMLASAELFHPGCGKVVISDFDTAFDLPADIPIWRISNFHRPRPELARLETTIAYLSQLEENSSDIVMLDYDILINGTLEKIFEESFDLALTYRFEYIELFNGGIYFIKADRIAAACRFLQGIRDQMMRLKPRYLIWFGFQIALLTYIDPKRFFARKSDTMVIDGFELHFLKCSQYNYTPEYESEIDTILPMKTCIHFKGDTKKWFWQFWKTHLLPKVKM